MKAPQLKLLQDKSKEYDNLIETEYKSDSATGESITVHNGAAARAQITIKSGKIEQEQREGYNLLKLNSTLSPANTDVETTFKEVKDPRFTKNISIVLAVKSGESYYISGDFSLLNSSVTREMFSEEYPVDGGVCTRLSNRNKNGSIAFDKDGYWVVEFLPSLISDEQIEKIENSFMIVHGDEEKEYESYGVSPSVEFPSSIQSVKSSYNVKRQNKNLAYNITYNSQSTQYYTLLLASYKLKKDKYYCISFDTENTGISAYFYNNKNNGFEKVSAIDYFVCDGTRKYYIIKAIDSDLHQNAVIINRLTETSNIATGYTKNFMIEQIPNAITDEEALKFAPASFLEHQEQNYNLNIPEGIELNKIDDVKDYFEMDVHEENGLIKIDELRFVQNIGKYIFDGTENTVLAETNIKTQRFYFNLNSKNFCAKNRDIYCNYFKNLEEAKNNINFTQIDKEAIHLRDDFTQIGIRVNIDRGFTSFSDLKNYIKDLYDSGNPMYIVYQLADPITTLIIDENFIAQVEALLNSKTHHGTTHIDIESLDNNPVPTLRLDYKVSNRITNDERFNKLENAILSLGNI